VFERRLWRRHSSGGGVGGGRRDPLPTSRESEAPLSSVEVEQANAGFYRAFESLDLGEMEAVWAHGEHVQCVHPGWPLLTGWDAVRASWETIFKNTAEIRFTITDVRAAVLGQFAWLTCTESILSEARGQISATSLLATNLFQRIGGTWLMIHHHASHILMPTSPTPEGSED
jgi:ketosteroid isomerase-like protein